LGVTEDGCRLGVGYPLRLKVVRLLCLRLRERNPVAKVIVVRHHRHVEELPGEGAHIRCAELTVVQAREPAVKETKSPSKVRLLFVQSSEVVSCLRRQIAIPLGLE
jgi:hypothetical protein